MMTHEPGSQLLGALLVLTAVAREWQRDMRRPLPAAPFEALQRGISELGQGKAARPLPCPDRYQQAWQGFLTNRRRGLDSHAIRHLCWHPDAAIDARFQDYLDRHHVMLGPRSLQGLVHACHARWSSELAQGLAVKAVWRRVATYEGQHQLLLRWKSALPMLLSVTGPAEMATAMVHHQPPVRSWCEAWGLDEHTPYMQQCVRYAAKTCLELARRTSRSSPLIQYLTAELLPWPGWRVEDFLEALAATILEPSVSALWEPLTQLVLRDPRLGDPRSPENADHWRGVPQAARQRVIHWLAGAAISHRF